MASNPMQKKTRTAFLLGFLVMLIIAVIVGGAIFFITSRNNKKQEQQQKQQQNVYVVNKKIESGQEITAASIVLKAVDTELVSQTEAFGASNSPIGYTAKIDLPAGTVLVQSMLNESGEISDSERIVEYNMLQLPVQLEVGEFVDIRFLLSNGQDYIVVSHKEVKEITADTIWLQLSEDEILLMSNAIVEAAISPATNIYIAKYVEPGLQSAATITYVPSGDVINLIANNPNIIQSSRDKLRERYQSYNSLVRGAINNELNKYSAEAIDNIEAGMIAAREKAIEGRQEYLYGVN